MKPKSEAPAGAEAGERGGYAHPRQAAQQTNSTPPTPLEPCEATIADFIAFIIDAYDGREGLIEIAWDDGGALKRARLFTPNQTNDMLGRAVMENRAGHNVYIAPALRRPDAPRDRRTKDEDVIAARFVWADFDTEGGLEKALAAFEAMGAAPNWITITGEFPQRRGQCFWMLVDDAPRDRLCELHAAIARRFNGDPAVQNPGRVMRIAGTIAWPRKSGRVIEMTAALHDRTRHASYAFADLRNALAPAYVNGAARDDHRDAHRDDSSDIEPRPTCDEIEALMGMLDPDMTYGDWLRVGMAIHNETGGAAWGLELWDAWSARGQKYRPGEPGQKWVSFKSDRDERVTLASIRRMAAPKREGVTAGVNPDPIPLGDDLPAVPAFPLELLPAALRPWIADASERLQCPPEFIAVPVMVAAGAAIGRRCAIRPKRRDDWIITPNLWGGIVGRPSSMKSPAINAALAPLRKLEAIAAEEHRKEMEVYEADFEKWEAKKAAAKSVRSKAAKAEMEGKASKPINADVGAKPLPPRPKRFITNDATYEAAGAIMENNKEGILVLRDELVSFLRPLDRPENAAARGFWLESWNGLGGYTFDRIGRGTVRLDAVCASLIGGVQPARLAYYVKAATSGGEGDDGLLQRFGLLVWPDSEPEWRDVDRYPDTDAKRAAASVFERLVRIDAEALGAAKGEFDELPWLAFDDEAQEVFTDWRATLERCLRADDLHPALESHYGKYRKLIPALALIAHLADTPEGGPVGADAMLSAVAWDEYLRPHAERIYAAATMPERVGAKLIWKRRHTLPTPFTAREVGRRNWTGLGDSEAVNAALGVLIDHHLMLAKLVGTTDQGGRPTMEFSVNPKAAAYD